MSKKATSLAALALKKPGAAPPSLEREGERTIAGRGASSIKGQTLRLNVEAWRQLKLLAVERAVPAHVLLVEAVNDLFRKYEKAPVA